MGVGIGTVGACGAGGVDTIPPSKRAKAGGSALSLSCCCCGGDKGVDVVLAEARLARFPPEMEESLARREAASTTGSGTDKEKRKRLGISLLYLDHKHFPPIIRLVSFSLISHTFANARDFCSQKEKEYAPLVD